MPMLAAMMKAASTISGRMEAQVILKMKKRGRLALQWAETQFRRVE
jgi:hypothetical protein